MGRAFIVGIALLGACAKAGDSAPSEPPQESLVRPAPAAQPKPSAGSRNEILLLNQIDRAELRVGGEAIDLGTPDQAKYTRGGWETGWGAVAIDGATTYTKLSARRGTLFPYLLAPRKSLAIRLRSAKRSQDVSVSVDGRKLATKAVGTKWTTLVWSLGKAATGRTRITLTHSGKTPVWVDWVWLDPAKTGAPSDPRVDGTALVARGTRSYSFYQWIEKGTELRFGLGSMGTGEFAVRVEPGTGGVVELFAHRGTLQGGKAGKISLHQYAGELVRITFSSRDVQGGFWAAPRLYVPGKGRGSGQTPAKNLVFVLLDTTRADAFPTFAKGSPVKTPVLDAFAKKGTAFLSAYNNANWTKPSVATILSGLYPTTHTALEPASVVPEGVGFLSQHLQSHGFYTAALTANYVVNEKFGFKKGWDHFKNYSRGRKGNGYYLYRNAAKWIRNRDKSKRFFLWVQSVDPHTTYDVPKEYWRPYFSGSYNGVIGPKFNRSDQRAVNDRSLRLSKKDKDWVRALYRGEVAYQDEQLGVFLQALEQEKLLDDTIVVITNDHGEEVLDRGQVGHGWSLYDEMIRAPLVIHYPPQFRRGVRDPRVVEHVDLAPTLVDVLGVPAMAGVEGESLLPRLRSPVHGRPPHYAFSMSANGKRAVRLGRYKLAVGERGWLGLYDLKTDSEERRDLRRSHGVAGRACEVLLGEALANRAKSQRGRVRGSSERNVAAQDATMDAATRAQLEALGYL